MNRVLLTVSGAINSTLTPQIAEGSRPRVDYLEMAHAFEADLIDYTVARRMTGTFGQLLEKVVGPDVMLAWACFKRRRDYAVIFTDGEQVGIPFALLCKAARARRQRHLMIVHLLSTRQKMVFFDLFGIQSQIHTFLVYSSWQQHFIRNRWHIVPEQVVLTPFMVDSAFFDEAHVHVARREMILAVGLEFRDYPTLVQAVTGLDVEVVIAAASPWSKHHDTSEGSALPPNVTVRRFSQAELRQVYAESRFVVMPLYDVPNQAGVTAILEAMAMARAVICTRTQGQTDVLVDGVTGLYVPPGDVAALRTAITRLLDNPAEAERMGKAGRVIVEQEMNLDEYVVRLNRLVRAALLEVGDKIREG